MKEHYHVTGVALFILGASPPLCEQKNLRIIDSSNFYEDISTMHNRFQNDEVSDTTEDDSSNTAKHKKIS